ncbi:hypothetical protein B0J12DRAFT_705938 [Macrophomina phaseolina]|uniref:Uncharacterized protein n=1 Tax=Macrophomina phaseolina TaxID=35725 RepID=A0ABQ8FQM9_9PEZI|nr:hypothetical protein B0J12DRAFT_705938 [Macrophomina phaseolina]
MSPLPEIVPNEEKSAAENPIHTDNLALTPPVDITWDELFFSPSDPAASVMTPDSLVKHPTPLFSYEHITCPELHPPTTKHSGPSSEPSPALEANAVPCHCASSIVRKAEELKYPVCGDSGADSIFLRVGEIVSTINDFVACSCRIDHTIMLSVFLILQKSIFLLREAWAFGRWGVGRHGAELPTVRLGSFTVGVDDGAALCNALLLQELSRMQVLHGRLANKTTTEGNQYTKSYEVWSTILSNDISSFIYHVNEARQ